MDSSLYQSGVKTLTALGGVVGVGIIVVLFLFFMNKKWFWLICASISVLISFSLFVASILNYQILNALLYAFVTWTCWSIAEIALKQIPEQEHNQDKSTNTSTKDQHDLS